MRPARTPQRPLFGKDVARRELGRTAEGQVFACTIVGKLRRMPCMFEISLRRKCPSGNVGQLVLMSKIFRYCPKQSFELWIACRSGFVFEHGSFLLRRHRKVELIEKLRQCLVARLPFHDSISDLCEGIGAHRSEYLRAVGVLARSAACLHRRRSSEKTRPIQRSPVRPPPSLEPSADARCLTYLARPCRNPRCEATSASMPACSVPSGRTPKVPHAHFPWETYQGRHGRDQDLPTGSNEK